MVKLCLALLLGIALSACAAPVQHHTASGRPEITVKAPVDKVKAVLLEDLVNWGYRPIQDTATMLVVDRPSDNAMANALLGSNFNPTANARLAFTFLPTGDSTRVVVDMAMVTNPGSGFEKLTPMNNSQDSATIQKWLDDKKAWGYFTR